MIRAFALRARGVGLVEEASATGFPWTGVVVLPRARRVNRPADFRRVMRGGRASGRRSLVVHVDVGDLSPCRPARAGLVVGRSVGPAVVRHSVSRRLRHLLRPRLDTLAPGTDVVVRARPAAAAASSAELARDLDAALARATRSAGAGGRGTPS